MLVSWFFASEARGQTTLLGSKTVRFAVQFSGDPFDPEQNDVRVLFVNRRGEALERLAFFDGEVWAARLSAPEPGVYVAKLRRNGVPTFEPDRTLRFEADEALPYGPVFRDPRHPAVLRGRTGVRWFGVGLDLTRVNLAPLEFLASLSALAQSGGTWAHVGAFGTAGASPWAVAKGSAEASALFNQRSLASWDRKIRLAEVLGVRLHFSLFSASDLLPGPDGWDRHPWREENGGFLRRPADFFAAESAKKRAKAWLRQAVARWGDSPALLSWSLLDQPALLSGDGSLRTVYAQWAGEMAAYAKQIAPKRRSPLYGSSGREDETFRVAEAVSEAQPVEAAEGLLFAVSWNDRASGDAGSRSRAALWRTLASGASAVGLGIADPARLPEQLSQVVRPFIAALSHSGYAVRLSPSAIPVTVSQGYEVQAIGETGWVLMRLVRVGTGDVLPASLRGLPLTDGSCELIQIDLLTGRVAHQEASVADFLLSEPFEPISSDVAVCVRSLGERWISEPVGRPPCGPRQPASSLRSPGITLQWRTASDFRE